VSGASAIAGVAAVAFALGHLLPAVGAPALALVIGMLIRLFYEPSLPARRLLAFGSRTVLQAAIVVLGATFSLGRVLSIGRSSLPLMLGTLAAVLVAAWLVGKALHVDPRLQTLVGVGTAICGASAISAVSGVIAATEGEIAYSISTIFVFNVVAVVLYPTLGHLLGLSQHAFGLWTGTAVNDTSSVVAAAYTYGHAAGSVAVVTKLARTTMIIPIVLVLAARHARRGVSGRRRVWRLVPPFLILFVVASALNTAGLFDARADVDLTHVATMLITVALASIGLSTRPTELRRTGFRPFALGAVLWAVVGISGLALQGVL
jgi:uncharacterized integral membrane protein (TIGR00698 family)